MLHIQFHFNLLESRLVALVSCERCQTTNKTTAKQWTKTFQHIAQSHNTMKQAQSVNHTVTAFTRHRNKAYRSVFRLNSNSCCMTDSDTIKKKKKKIQLV